MRLTDRRLNRATLARQLLLRREPLGVVDGVRRVVALQAQEPPSPYVALWNRLAGFDGSALHAAFLERRLVKASSIRLTLHAAYAADQAVYHAAMLPSLRASRLNDRRFTNSGLKAAEVDALLPELLGFLHSPRTSAEIESWLAARLAGDGKWAWWALRTYAPLQRAPTGGPWSFEAAAMYQAAGWGRADASASDQPAHDAAVERLLLGYLAGFGPATKRDFEQYTMLRRPVVLRALTALNERLVEYAGPDGATLHDLAHAPLPDEGTPAPPRLLPMWESALLAYADRSRVIPPDYRGHVIRRNGDVLPTLLVDGYVAGVWRPVAGGIEATAFHRLPADYWQALEGEASALRRFLAGRDSMAYRRFWHWWDKLPAAEVRLLGG